MRASLLFATCILFYAVTSYGQPLELPECKRVGYSNCNVGEPCNATVSARGGMCIKLLLPKSAKYRCNKTGVVAIDKFDMESARIDGVMIKTVDHYNFELDSTAATKDLVNVMFGIYDPYDTPEKFSISCNKLS